MDLKPTTTSLLDALVEDESQVSTKAEELLIQIFKPYAFIGKDSKSINLRDEADILPPRLKILLYFLGRLAGKRLGYIEDDSISQKEVIEFYTPHGIPEGTIKVSLKQLREERLIVGATTGRYKTGFDKLEKIQKIIIKYAQKNG
jgi:hypothetical protein